MAELHIVCRDNCERCDHLRSSHWNPLKSCNICSCSKFFPRQKCATILRQLHIQYILDVEETYWFNWVKDHG